MILAADGLASVAMSKRRRRCHVSTTSCSRWTTLSFQSSRNPAIPRISTSSPWPLIHSAMIGRSGDSRRIRHRRPDASHATKEENVLSRPPRPYRRPPPSMAACSLLRPANGQPPPATGAARPGFPLRRRIPRAASRAQRVLSVVGPWEWDLASCALSREPHGVRGARTREG